MATRINIQACLLRSIAAAVLLLALQVAQGVRADDAVMTGGQSAAQPPKDGEPLEEEPAEPPLDCPPDQPTTPVSSDPAQVSDPVYTDTGEFIGDRITGCVSGLFPVGEGGV